MVGWRRVGPHPAILEWARAARPLAVAALAASAEPLRCGGTWAVGLDLLPNAADGSLGGVALPWGVLGLAPEPLHAAQVSAVYPGYPQPSDEETAAAYKFRLSRDAAHLDGLLAVGPDKRRMVKELHGWILGLPLTDCDRAAAPLVVWEGSHRIMQAALLSALHDHPAQDWPEVDVTAAYQAARAQVFETCNRVELPGRVGEALILHRLLIHGVAAWGQAALAPPEGRIIAYFRPTLRSVTAWLHPD